MQEHNHEMYMGSKYKDLMAPVQLDEHALQNQLIGQIIPHIQEQEVETNKIQRKVKSINKLIGDMKDEFMDRQKER